ncbi:MAG: glyoxylase-like metal-dependent hydrolase (beta-lactamase superfamily II) [Candidatus Azotimanducaceae bacterium]|jgi:glyoxylase-like metal-dependent hydrolase (beta-lactamase superfamily II)
MIYMNGLVSLTGVRASPAVLSALLFTLMIAAFVGATVHATGSVERGVVARHLLPLSLTKVTEAVYVAVGDTNAPTYDNGGHNNNLSVILTSDGVVVVNGGDSYRLAARLHLAIKQLTPMSVVWVVNENGQGHAFLGNSYWRDQGATIIAHQDALAVIEERGAAVLRQMQERNRDKAAGTYVAVPDMGFEHSLILNVGTTRVLLTTFGEAHSPGDISVWLDDEKILIAGDIAFHQRLLAIFPDTHVPAWIISFEKMAQLKPRVVIPGHGEPTDIKTLRQTTQGYLQFLTQQVQAILETGDGLAEAYAIDQSDYAHLNTFNELAVKNAGRLFQTMEMASF